MAGVKSRKPTPQIIRRWIKDGYGQGQGIGYKPLMYVRDVPSKGTSSMVTSRITGRTHHYLSRQEFKVHLLAEYSSSIVDIREQFALLPWEETYETAQKLGIRHPIYPGTKTPVVLTSDILLSKSHPDGIELLAISVKLTKDLTHRALEKLLLERIYWNTRGVRWILATEQNIPAVRVKNLQFFEAALNGAPNLDSSIFPACFSQKFESNHTPDLSFNEILKKTALEVGTDLQTAHILLGRAIWDGTSRIDIDTSILNHRSNVILR